ncbi:MAG: aminotransferase, partial [Clostridia bacterium]|nr:aminotransferase [Clostridia bacterium]
MANYLEMSKQELEKEFSAVKAEFDKLLSLKLSLDMSRGKPNFDNMDLSDAVLTAVDADKGYKDQSGTDTRNYGGLDGITEMKKLFGEILGVAPEQVIVGGNASLTMMFDTVAQGMTH